MNNHVVIEFPRNLVDRQRDEADGDDWIVFRNDLTGTPAILNRFFNPVESVTISIYQLFLFKDEEWLDGGLLDAIADIFDRQYYHRSRFMYFSAHVVSAWSSGDSWRKRRERIVIELITCAQMPNSSQP